MSGIPEYTPMHPTQAREPFGRPGWVWEEKVDGYRMLAYRDGKRIRLVSRNGVDYSKRFPELVAAIGTLRSSSLVLDAEVAVFDQRLRSRFDWLRSPDPEAVASPPLLMVFDLLYRAGHDLSPRPLRERRELEELVAGGDRISRSAGWHRTGWRRGPKCSSVVNEGYVGKDEASPCEAGRTRRWVKVKVPGWTDPEDRWRRVRLED